MPEPRGPLRILVRSDSQGTSVGEGTIDPRDERLWAACLQRLLIGRGIEAEVRNTSAAGLRLARALQVQRTDPLAREAAQWADIVVVGLSINDFWPVARPQWLADWMDRARPMLLRRALRRGYKKVRHPLLELTKGRIRPTKPSEARDALAALVDELRSTGCEVVLLTPLPVRSPVNRLLDGNTYEACDMVLEVGAAAGVPAVDCRHLFPPIAWETISIDHLHANPEGHELIATTIADILPVVAAGAGDDIPKRATGDVLVRGDSDVAAALTAVDDGWHVALVRGFSVHDENWGVAHDPLVRQAVAAARAVVLAPGGAARPTAWDREQLDHLVDVLRRQTNLVLVDDGGSWSAAITAAGGRFGVPVASFGDVRSVVG